MAIHQSPKTQVVAKLTDHDPDNHQEDDAHKTISFFEGKVAAHVASRHVEDRHDEGQGQNKITFGDKDDER